MKKNERQEQPVDTAEASRENREDSGESRLPREIGGRDGPDPTRYGDWEKAGRCVDF